MWEVEGTDEFEEWYMALDERETAKLTAAIDQLQQAGPNLKRPLVGEVKGSTIRNLKEIRVDGKGFSVRVLFAFDPRRTAILLLGGDKSEHGWKAWYPGAIAKAESLYDEYLDDLRRQNLIE